MMRLGGYRKQAGAPLKNAPGRVPYHEVDRLLVFGELVDGPEGEPPFVVYPSFRAIARRYGVNHSVIAGYAKRRDCLKRREQAQQRVTARVDDKLVEQRATEVAVGKGEAVRVIDTFIKGFEAALEEGRVRMDNPADFNTMLRLKEFLLGGPDARQEVHASLALEELQRRHARMMSVTGDVNAETLAGVVSGRRMVEDDGREVDDDSPPADFDGSIAELHGHSGDQGGDEDGEDDPFAND